MHAVEIYRWFSARQQWIQWVALSHRYAFWHCQVAYYTLNIMDKYLPGSALSDVDGNNWVAQFLANITEVPAIISDMMTSSIGNIFRVTGPLCGNSPVPGEFLSQRPVTRSFDVFIDMRLNKRLSWFETPSCSLRRHRNELSDVNHHDGRTEYNAFYTICRL